MKKLGRAAIALGALLALALVGLNVLAYRHAYSMMHFSTGQTRTLTPEKLTMGQKLGVLWNGVNIPRPQTRISPADLGSGCQEIKIPGVAGITLGAWYCPLEATSPLVILFHAYGGEKGGVLHEARAFLEMKHAVLLVDFRGSGASSESLTTIGYDEAEDVAAAVRYARDHFTPTKIILYGQSMGAAAVLRAVDKLQVKPDAIIVEAVFDRLLNTVRHRFEAMGLPSFPSAELLVFWGGRQAGFNGFLHNPVDYAAGVGCPILFLHGSDDPRARVGEGRHVFAAVPGPKRFHEFAGSRHEPSVVRFPKEWKEEVADFLGELEKNRLD